MRSGKVRGDAKVEAAVAYLVTLSSASMSPTCSLQISLPVQSPQIDPLIGMAGFLFAPEGRQLALRITLKVPTTE